MILDVRFSLANLHGLDIVFLDNLIDCGTGGFLVARAPGAGFAPTLTLKGLGAGPAHPLRARVGHALLLAGALLALLPPIRGMPLGAYVSVALLLVGALCRCPGWWARCWNAWHPG